MKLSVVIPVYNEETTLQEILKQVRAVGLAYEIIIVDDGSTDGTGAVADGLVASFPFLRVLHHRRNQGLTAALRTGFSAVRGEFYRRGRLRVIEQSEGADLILSGVALLILLRRN